MSGRRAYAAGSWLPQFLLMPLFACESTLKYMTGQPGVTTPVKFPSAEGNAQFAPYRHDRHSEDTTNIDFRELNTYLGNVRIDFEPLQYIRLVIGQGTATLGDGQMQAPTAKLVIETVMKSLGHHLHNCLFTATSDPTVLGIKPIPNIQDKIAAMLDKYRKETIDIEHIEFEEVDLEESELFPSDNAANNDDDCP